MYLKKIEAQGFKSFANKAVLEFSPGIMGIVGPNGSGKSNVADAVRWVLGEQSAKQLRGGSMQDVIFSGTEARKPMGYAYVSLTLDNADHVLPVDYDEVTVTRQVFRSGESEYRINGNPCRLRDIYEMFYDSGIGKEGYSIIGQGQIDQVLSNKPEERRLMFDEAAGITKYRKRRDITAKKLDSERQSLQRISDIIGELKRQVGPLEKQSAKAKTYLKLRDELRSYEIGAYYLEATDLEKKLGKTQEDLEIVTGDLEKSHADEDTLKQQYDELTKLGEALDGELQGARGELADLRVLKENKEGRIILLEEQIRTSAASQGLTADRIAALDRQIAEINAEKEDIYRQKNELDVQLDESDDRISAAETEAEDTEEEIRAVEFELEQKNRFIIETMNEKVNISGELQGLNSKEEQMQLRVRAIEQTLKENRKKSREREEQSRALSASLDDMRAELARLKEEADTHREAQKKAEETLTKSREAFHQFSREYSVLQTRRETLENLAERYEGYNQSVRRVMEQKAKFPGVRGVTADLITTDKRYETAIETALGGRIQNVVTDTEDTAKRIIEYLKENRFGRVTFLPVDAVDGPEAFPFPEALREKGVIGRASELVKADKSLAGVVRFLLGHVLVAEDMDKALSLARKYRYRMHIVTLEGEYLAPGGSISGGAFKSSSNLLGRSRELAEVTETLKQKKKDLDAAKLNADEAEKLASAERELFEKAAAERSSLSLKEAALSSQAESRKREDREALERDTALEVEQQKIREDIKAVAEERLRIQKRAVGLDRDNETRQSEVSRSMHRLEKEKEKLAEKTKILEDLRLEFANLNQKNEFILENIRRLNSETDRLEEEKKTLGSTVGNEEEAEAERRSEIEQLRKEIEDETARMNELDIFLEEKQKEQEVQRTKQQGFFEAREDLTRRISELDKENYRLEANKQRLEEQIEKQAEYIWSEYEMTPSQAKATRREDIVSLTEARRYIAQKKGEIKELGPVNVGAIDEYKEVAERYEFLNAQYEDLVKAEGELVGMISELESGMRKQFKERFEQIRAEFGKVFSELFAGGKGSLELEPGEDVLSAGVIINAQPPGKKLVNMMQLSGGEKALTAIALLFAIQNLKPSPFCLLDEIEAALDEPNVNRFADYLARLKGSTQFIVITHRRGTMEMTDRLYGITMQEKGVSALVSVSLTDAKKTKELLGE
ncbi:MAG: chromosome segregation protein SMC [Lachnospiraceae bacterium]|nr:chromosome segregation protein SMC [Lachnospiraceae bacterium]